jgi:hypothetical protein
LWELKTVTIILFILLLIFLLLRVVEYNMII